jgi:hypothetical protein
MKMQISGAAAKWIIERVRVHIQRLGSDYIPILAWTVHDTGNPTAPPHLSISLDKRSSVPEDRFVECDEFACEIAQHIPDDILANYPSRRVVLSANEELVFASSNDR